MLVQLCIACFPVNTIGLKVHGAMTRYVPTQYLNNQSLQCYSTWSEMCNGVKDHESQIGL